jgi:ferrous iron transport protein A
MKAIMAFWSSWVELMPSLLPRHGAAGRAGSRPPRGPMALDGARTGQECRVVAVHAPDAVPDWARWLGEIGFLPGERVTVTTRSPWGGDPMVVRVGQSGFALRRAEAACVQVESL